jgi:hypothetical protein
MLFESRTFRVYMKNWMFTIEPYLKVTKEGVILAVEKRLSSVLLEPSR